MADGGPPVPQLPLQPQHCLPHLLYNPPVHPAPHPIQPGTISQLNWSHFKPESTGKPDEDVEAHLLRTNNWMETHAFPEGVKVQMFCLTLGGEARLWYESLRPTALDWLTNKV